MKLLFAALCLLPALALAQITSLPSPACAKPTFTVPAGANITVTWIAPTKSADGSAISGTLTYNLYSLAGPNPVQILAGITGTSTVRTNLSVGTPCYAVTSSVSGVESATLSNTASVNVISTPLPPTGVTCTLNIPSGGGAVTGNCTTQ
jgi:hypothetical protein